MIGFASGTERGVSVEWSVAEEGWEGVSDAGEPGGSGEDAEGDHW